LPHSAERSPQICGIASTHNTAHKFGWVSTGKEVIAALESRR
jgi:hypothetical protein